MKVTDLLKNPGLKKGFGVVSTIVMCIAAVGNVLAEKEREQEFEEMKKTLSELTNKTE